jgi:AGCS family alanine or glycine:cation symporter
VLQWIESIAESISDLVNGALGPAAEFLEHYVWGWPEKAPLLAIVLLGTGLFVTLRLGFIQVRGFKHGVDIARGVYDNPEDEGDLVHFQALTTALSATVGIGNIAGVAIAIRLGGPGALFWMWLTAVFGMALKYAECTLALAHRKVNEDGSISGGPMYYIEMGLGRRWRWMALIFAACAAISSFGGGNMNQSNTLADQIESYTTSLGFPVPTFWTGLIFATLVALVIIGGIRRIGRVTSILAPGMALLYVAGALLILILNFDKIIPSLALIVEQAFAPRPLVGGAAGSLLMTVMWGIRRGLFSNEAGQGSAPIAHATAKTDEPVREGLVASLGPFIDTLVICTMTGLVIVLTGAYKDKVEQTFDATTLEAVVDRTVSDERLAELRETRTGGRLEVVDGQLLAGGLVALDAVIEDPWLSDPDGRPWTGQLDVAADGGLSVADGGVTPEVRGNALLIGAPLTARGFQIGLGATGTLIVTLAVILFAVSTAISWSYYGDRSVEYLFGSGAIRIYRWIFIFFFFVGAMLPLKAVWTFGDVALGLMSFPNLVALVLLTGSVVAMTKDYYSRKHERYR